MLNIIQQNYHKHYNQSGRYHIAKNLHELTIILDPNQIPIKSTIITLYQPMYPHIYQGQLMWIHMKIEIRYIIYNN